MTLRHAGDEVRHRLSSTRFDSVRWYDQIASTNQLLLDEARQSAASDCVVVADSQTAGRGRLDRQWLAPAGSSLLASVLVRPAVDAETRAAVLLAAALGGAGAIRDLTSLDARLKWPNDVVVGDRKLGGLLAESHREAIVVGFGCNVAWAEMPPSLAPEATSIDIASGQDPPPVADLLVAWLERFERHLSALESGRAREVLDRAADLMTTLGRRVRVTLAAETLIGRADRLGPHGELVVVGDDGAERLVTVGDIVHLRPA